jgi:hypothetical protein
VVDAVNRGSPLMAEDENVVDGKGSRNEKGPAFMEVSCSIHVEKLVGTIFKFQITRKTSFGARRKVAGAPPEKRVAGRWNWGRRIHFRHLHFQSLFF